MSKRAHAVTGAFGYSGKYITERLLKKGITVKTLTNSMYRFNTFKEEIEVCPFNFDNPEKLKDSLKGVDVLYNTYWIRFNCNMFSMNDAVKNSYVLFKSAKEAGVKRIVHISITNPSLESGLEYFMEKAMLEKKLAETGIPYSILRPAVLFGKEDILINNIAWVLRKFPVFGIFGNGRYKIQPIYVDDLAKLAVDEGGKTGNRTINAIGPETFTFMELVQMIARKLNKKRLILPLPPGLALIAAYIIQKLTGDILITREELKGLMSGYLAVDSKPVGKVKLSEWIEENAETVGLHYTSELSRRKNRVDKYKSN